MYVLIKQRYSPTAHQWDEDCERIVSVEVYASFDEAVQAGQNYEETKEGWGDPTWRVYLPGRSGWACPGNLSYFQSALAITEAEDYDTVVQVAKELCELGKELTVIRAVRQKYNLGLKEAKNWTDMIRAGVSDGEILGTLKQMAVNNIAWQSLWK